MTESEWLACNEPQAMLDCEYMDNASPRKLRLFACACCRRIWRLLADPRSKEAVERAEEYAEGRLNANRLRLAVSAAWNAHLLQHDAGYHASQAATWVADDSPGFAAREAADAAIAATVCDPNDPEEDNTFQSSILRDIFAIPFRPVSLNVAWQTLQVVALAQAIYDDRAFDRLLELAEALEKAGCDDADILTHCRSSGPHVRGCWVIDLLLGKE